MSGCERSGAQTAKQNLSGTSNVSFHLAGVDTIPLPNNSLDFAYSLGVLHHVPDTAAAIRDIADKLKPGAPFLIYLYYAFDNRPAWFRAIWRVSAWLRLVVSRLPYVLRLVVSQLIALTVYWPLARIARALDAAGRFRLRGHWPTTETSPSTSCAQMRSIAFARGWNSDLRAAQIKSMLGDADSSTSGFPKLSLTGALLRPKDDATLLRAQFRRE